MNRLFLSKDIYTSEFVEKGISAFSNLAEVKHEMDERYHILIFDNCYYDEELTKREFANYIVDLMVSKNV